MKTMKEGHTKACDCVHDYSCSLHAAAPLMYDFVKSFAGPCHNDPGEYPEEGESGHAPCNACRANALVAKAEGVA